MDRQGMRVGASCLIEWRLCAGDVSVSVCVRVCVCVCVACSCPALLVTGQQSVFNGTTRSLHQSILKTCGDKTKIEFIEVGGVANVLEEKVKLSFSLACITCCWYSAPPYGGCFKHCCDPFVCLSVPCSSLKMAMVAVKHL